MEIKLFVNVLKLDDLDTVVNKFYELRKKKECSGCTLTIEVNVQKIN